MLKLDNMKAKIELYIKFLIIFLVVFLPSRNILELCCGTLIKLIPDVLVLGLFLLFFIYKRGRLQIKSYDLILLLFFGVTFFNTIVLQKISLYVYIFEVRSIILYYILFFVIRNFEFDEKYILVMTKVLRCITYILFVLAVIEKIGNKTILFPASVAESIIYADNYARVYSMFFNPNTYGAFLVFSFFLVLYYEKGRKKFNLYRIIAISSLLLTMSRSAILIFAVGLIVYGVLFKKEALFEKKFILHCLTVVIASLLVYSACEKVTELIWYTDGKGMTTVIDRLEELQEEEMIDKSLAEGRIYYLKKGFKIFKDYPILGTGFGTFGSAASMNWEPPIYEKYDLNYGFYSDNEYIKDLVETGIIGMLLLAAFCIVLIYRNRLNFFCVFMITVFGWFGLFYNVLEVQIVALLFWGFLGISGEKLPQKQALPRKE